MLVVPRVEAEQSVRIVQRHQQETLPDEGAVGLAAGVELSEGERACIACGHVFPEGPSACPDCGISLGSDDS